MTLRTHELTVAVLSIATAKHLLDRFSHSVVFWILTQKLLEPVMEDLFESLQRKAWRLSHSSILAETYSHPFRINNLKSKFQGDQVPF